MKRELLLGLCVTWGAGLAACGKKSSGSSTSNSGGTTVSGSGGASSSPLTVGDLALIPSADSFLAASSTTASLALSDRADGYSLVTGTPPHFTDISKDITTYLTGTAPAAIATTITADITASNYTGANTELGSFLDAGTKCGVMEHTARIVNRLREDTAPLCLLEALPAIGNTIWKFTSGTPVPDLTKLFQPTDTDQTIQIGMTDRGQPMFEIVEIQGMTTNSTGFHMRYSTCVTASKVAFRQNVVDVNNATGAITFSSYNAGSLDPNSPAGAHAKPDSYFQLGGTLVSNGAGGVIPDTAQPRTVGYAESGAIGQFSSSVNQASMTITGNELQATFFESDTGKDPSGNSLVSTDKTALDTSYTGTGSADLTIFEGAGRSQLSMTGTPPGSSTVTTNVTDHSIGFAFDNTQTPNYATAATSAFLTNIGAVDFATDAVLSQTAPIAPDLTKIDNSPCSATPTSVIGYIVKPEDNATYAAALASCNTFPAATVAGAPNPPINMCDPVRDQEHAINGAIHQYQQAKGAPPLAGQKG